jgi:hypothetical protein
MEFAVTLSAASSQDLTFRVDTVNGTAAAGSDFAGITNGILSFKAGETQKKVAVQVNGDTLVESDETFSLALSNLPSNVSLQSGGGIGTIQNDDEATTSIFEQSNAARGLVVIEAEQFHKNLAQGAKNWVEVVETGASGGKAMKASPDSGALIDKGYTSKSPRLDYQIDFTKTGTHYVWILGRAGGSSVGSSDSLHVGLNGQAITSSDRVSSFSASYGWSNWTMDSTPAAFNVTSTGLNTLNLWMREDGFIVDKIILTTDPTYNLTSVNGNNVSLEATDTLLGTQKADLFILGDREGLLYDNAGLEDFAAIDNFDIQNDRIQLHGTIDDYTLARGSIGDRDRGTSILYQDDLIAVVSGENKLDLASTISSFVA